MCLGIYVSNRAQTDAKAVGALVDFASKQAAAGTGKLLLAATGAARYGPEQQTMVPFLIRVNILGSRAFEACAGVQKGVVDNVCYICWLMHFLFQIQKVHERIGVCGEPIKCVISTNM